MNEVTVVPTPVAAPNLLTEQLEMGSPAYELRNRMLDEGIDPEFWAELPDSVYVAAITNSGWFSQTGLDIPESASDVDIAVAVRASRTLHSSDAWMRGDLLAWVRRVRFLEKDIPVPYLERLADELGLGSRKTALNCEKTSRAWPMEFRHPTHELSYSHHAAIADAKLPLEEMREWAEKAAADGMSVRALRAALQDDAVSITPASESEEEGESTERVVVFASDKFSKKDAMRTVARLIARETRSVKSPLVAAENVLTRLLDVGLIRFPAKAWLDARGVSVSSESSFSELEAKYEAQLTDEEDEEEELS